MRDESVRNARWRRRWSRAGMAKAAMYSLIAGVLVSLSAAKPGHLEGDGTVAERRAGHVRVLSQCGRKKACVRKPSPRSRAARAAERAAADSLAAVPPRRWSGSEVDSLAVWIGPGDSVPLWRTPYRTMVRDAFHAWTAAGAPVRFIFVADSARADVRVVWTDSLTDGRAGQVTRFIDVNGWLTGAVVEMSTRSIVGKSQDTLTVRAVALHEVGHVLGLEHTRNERDIMAAWVLARAITSRDRAAMHALYGAASTVPAAR